MLSDRNVRLQQPLATRGGRVMVMMLGVDQVCHKAEKLETVARDVNPLGVRFIIPL